MRPSESNNIGKPEKLKCVAAALGIILLLMAGVLGSGCIFPADSGETTPEDIDVTDDSGTRVVIPGNLSSIISLSSAITEMIYAVEAQDMLIGVCDESDYPADAQNKEVVAGWGGPDFERIMFLAPDIVIASDMTAKQDVEKLREMGLRVLYLDPENLDDILKDIFLIGNITRNAKKAGEVVASLDARIDEVSSKTSANGLERPCVYIEYYPYWTYGPGSFGDSLVSMAGGQNIGKNGSNAYFEITSEEVVGANPEIIVYTVGSMGITTKEELVARSGWDSIDAVKEDEIYTLPDDLISRPGPRMVDGLEELARIFHPDLFPV